jgi:hypothetical protein
MRTFLEFIKLIDNDLGISGSSTEESLAKLAKLAARDHTEEMLDFFNTLAKNDKTIRDELDNINRNNANRPIREKGKPSLAGLDNRRDELVPSSADNASGIEPATW